MNGPETDPYNDPAFQAFYNEVAKRCKCCSECGNDTVCGGALQGAGCDRICTCDADADRREREEDEDPYGDRFDEWEDEP